MSNVVYLADSGRATTGDAEPATKSTNGRVWRLEFDPRDPTKAKLSVLVQGDDNPVKTLAEIHQPDNLETTRKGRLLVQEDPSSAQQFALTDPDPRKTAARIWQVDLGTFNPAVPDSASKGVVAVVNQGLDENTNPALGAIDVDPLDTPRFAPGAFPISPGNPGRVGIERDRRRLVGVWRRCVPGHGPGAHVLGRQRTRIRPGCASRPRLHEETGGRPASVAAPHTVRHLGSSRAHLGRAGARRPSLFAGDRPGQREPL
jgi:hypothetical protein